MAFPAFLDTCTLFGAYLCDTRRIAEMRPVFPDAEVTGYEPLIASMTCDQKDRHVLAAAARARAEVLVTFNVRDFPDDSTSAYDVQVVETDSFLLDQLDLYPGLVMGALHRQSSSYKRPETSLRDLLMREAGWRPRNHGPRRSRAPWSTGRRTARDSRAAARSLRPARPVGAGRTDPCPGRRGTTAEAPDRLLLRHAQLRRRQPFDLDALVAAGRLTGQNFSITGEGLDLPPAPSIDPDDPAAELR